jgi:molybdopterin-guanine dinucleotide biosynthesis protein A
MKTTAVILAGGRGSRMGNRDKAWVEFLGEPLISHVIRRIEPLVDEIIISYNQSEEKFSDLPYRRFRDAFGKPNTDPSTGTISYNAENEKKEESYLGPLSGIHSCFEAISTPLTLVVPCDMPFLPTNLLDVLKTNLAGHTIAIANDGVRNQHLVFLTQTRELATIARYLASGKRSVSGWCESLNQVVATFNNDASAFQNINEQSQLR